MPRIARCLADEQIYHIINRGNRREEIFHEESDYEKFLKLLKEAKDKFTINIYAYCLMSNHYHLVVYTKIAKNLSQFMQWIGTSYVRYYNAKYKISGHLWQGRYKSFIVQTNNHLLILLRYVEANPLRANIVKNAIDYKYNSTKIRVNNVTTTIIDKTPIEIPKNWLEFVNDKENPKTIESIRNSINRQSPFGEKDWKEKIAKKYGLESTLNNIGRPKKNRV